MSTKKKFKKFAGQYKFIAEGYTTVYIPRAGEVDEDDLMYLIESYHPMEELDEGYEVVALCKRSPEEEAQGFVAINEEEDVIVIYEDGNDEPLDTPASQITLEEPE